MKKKFNNIFLNYKIKNDLINSKFVPLKIYKKITILSICQDKNLVNSKK